MNWKCLNFLDTGVYLFTIYGTHFLQFVSTSPSTIKKDLQCRIKKYYFLMNNIFVWKFEKPLNTIFQRMFVFRFFFLFCLFVCFLLLANTTLYVIFYTHICYWNTFQYKYIIEITFHVVKQSHVRVTSKDICLLFIILFLSVLSFCLNFVLFHEALLLLCCLIDLVYSYI